MTGLAQVYIRPAATGEANRPKVSLCVPAYQAERHIRRTIESLLAQRHDDFEVVVIDNNCTDGTAEVLESFDDNRIRVVRNDSTVPLVDNFNRAVAECRGDYVKLVCADDLLHPECVAAQTAVLDANPDVALVGVQTDFVDDEGVLLRAGRGLRGVIGRHPAARVVRRIVRSGTNPIGAPAAVMFRRADFLRAGGFRDELLFLADVELWVRLLHHGDFYGIPRTLASFRFGSQTVSATMAARSQLAQYKAFVSVLAAQQRWTITGFDRLVCRVNTYDKQLRRILLFAISKRRDARRHR